MFKFFILVLVSLSIRAGSGGVSQPPSTSFSLEDVRFACKRGPLAGVVWVDAPTVNFLEKLKNSGYSNNRVLGIGYLICRDKRLAIANGSQIKNYRSNKDLVDKYISKMSVRLRNVLNQCRPSYGSCFGFSSILPLEGKYNNWVGFPIPIPVEKNIISTPYGTPVCEKGSTKNIWIDRPTNTIIMLLINAGYDDIEAIGVAYSVCRNKNIVAGYQMAREFKKFLGYEL